MSVPSSSSSVLSSTSPSLPLVEGSLLELVRDWTEGALEEDLRVWERSPSGFLTDTEEEVDAIDWTGLRLGYSPRGAPISPVGQK